MRLETGTRLEVDVAEQKEREEGLSEGTLLEGRCEEASLEASLESRNQEVLASIHQADQAFVGQGVLVSEDRAGQESAGQAIRDYAGRAALDSYVGQGVLASVGQAFVDYVDVEFVGQAGRAFVEEAGRASVGQAGRAFVGQVGQSFVDYERPAFPDEAGGLVVVKPAV